MEISDLRVSCQIDSLVDSFTPKQGNRVCAFPQAIPAGQGEILHCRFCYYTEQSNLGFPICLPKKTIGRILYCNTLHCTPAVKDVHSCWRYTCVGFFYTPAVKTVYSCRRYNRPTTRISGDFDLVNRTVSGTTRTKNRYLICVRCRCLAITRT